MRLKKIGCFVLSICMAASVMNIITFASDDNYQILAKKYSELSKADLGTSNYKFKLQYNEDNEIVSAIADDFTFSDGVIGGTIDDFDNDNEYELLVFELKNNTISDDNSEFFSDNYGNTIETDIYEVVDGQPQLVGKSDIVYGNLCGSYGGTECFVKTVDNKKYIAVCNGRSNAFADGDYYNTNIYEYSNNNLNKVITFAGAGSAPHVSASDANKFKEIGFENTYNYFCEDNMGADEYIFTPSFGVFNIANMEDNVKKIVEILITNDVENYPDNSDDYTQYYKTIVDNATISVNVNDFTDIKYEPNIETTFYEETSEEDSTGSFSISNVFESFGKMISNIIQVLKNL